MVLWKNIAEESWSRLFHLHLCRSGRRPAERTPLAWPEGAPLACPVSVRPPWLEGHCWPRPDGCARPAPSLPRAQGRAALRRARTGSDERVQGRAARSRCVPREKGRRGKNSIGKGSCVFSRIFLLKMNILIDIVSNT